MTASTVTHEHLCSVGSSQNDQTTDLYLPPVHEYFIEVGRYRAQNPSQREGQAAMNVLYGMNPVLYQRVMTTPLDPFYRDELVSVFYQFLCDHWED